VTPKPQGGRSDSAPGTGCDFCRSGSTTSSPIRPIRLGEAADERSVVFRCIVCTTFWDEGEAYPQRIPLTRARVLLPDLDLS
jgi:hypothetical protein